MNVLLDFSPPPVFQPSAADDQSRKRTHKPFLSELTASNELGVHV